MNPPFVISFADLVADVIIKIPRLPVEAAGHQTVSDISLEPGGAGNFLIAGQRLGMQMGSLAIVGSDPFGEEIVDIIRAEGVDVAEIIFVGRDGTSTVFVLLDEDRQHVFLGKYGAGQPVQLSKAWKLKIQTADAVQFWGYSFLEERIRPALIEAVKYASQQSRLISFDPGPLFSGVSEDHRQLLLSHADLVLLTEDEIPSLLGEGASLQDATNILAAGPRLVCVKRGALGCTLFSPEGQLSFPGFPVEIRDTSAAGDAFNAAFLFGYLCGWPLDRVALLANAMGAAKVQKQGSGRNVPSKDEVMQILKTFHVDISNLP